jgi:hypothetical protein
VSASETIPTAQMLHEVQLSAGELTGRLLDNLANHNHSGFNPLWHSFAPGNSLFRTDLVGLNYEHIYNGAAADREISMFTPRKENCELVVHSTDSATLRWPLELSAWKIGCELSYRLIAPHAVDLTFSATPTVDRFPLRYVVFMWASYMNRTRERTIHFLGRDGAQEGWINFGEDTPEGFETGAVGYEGLPPLRYEEGAQTLNILEHPTKQFKKPFYYGLLDADHDLKTATDTLVYIMMFDQTEPIRFALWNFIQDEQGKPDPHSPAWDWQFVIRQPVVGQTYRYHARVVIKPFLGREDVEREYEAWRRR